MDETEVEKPPLLKPYDNWLVRTLSHKRGEVAVPYIVTSDAVIPEEKKPSVFIFDEEFVQENVRTKGNGLETIVMMGEQVDLDTQITAKKAEGTVVDSKVVEQTALKEKYENANDTSSPQYFLTRSEMNCVKMAVGQILTEILRVTQ